MMKRTILKCSILIPTIICVCGTLPMHTSAATDCSLDNAQINDISRVYARLENGHWSLVRNEHFNLNEALHLLCDGQATVMTHCRGGRAGGAAFDRALPLAMPCPSPIRAIVDPVPDAACAQLGGQLYRVGYAIGPNDFLEIYSSCYDATNVRALYVRHQVYGSSVPASYFIRPDFSTDRIISGASKAAFTKGNVYNRFEALLGPRQRYVLNNRTLVVERGHLAASGDFLTYDQMRETFKMINVMPQFRCPNRSNWKRIENWIKQLATTARNPLSVLTGTLGVLELPHSITGRMQEMYLDAGRIPIPRDTYKVIRHGRICYVLVTHNNQFATNAPATVCSRVIACPATLSLSAVPSAGYTYCCNYADFVRTVGNHVRLC